MKVVKKPFEATQWHKHGDHKAIDKVPNCLKDTYQKYLLENIGFNDVGYLDGYGIIYPGNWIIEDAYGIVDVKTNDEFKKTYMPVKE